MDYMIGSASAFSSLIACLALPLILFSLVDHMIGQLILFSAVNRMIGSLFSLVRMSGFALQLFFSVLHQL
jgi:hypothetical protein